MPDKLDAFFKVVSQPAYTIEQLRKQGLNDAEIGGYQAVRDVLNAFLKDVIDRWKLLDENLVDIEKIVEKFIEIKIGGLKDLPYELYEPIQNLLHEYFGLIKEATHPGWLPHQVKNAKNIETGLNLFIEERSKLQAQVESLPDIIKELRNVAAHSNSDGVEYAVRLILDQLKYGIKKAGYKPKIVRDIERWWIKFKRWLTWKRG